MSEAPARTKEIGTDLLLHGLYVHTLDRPWLETPFLFQGFKIETDSEIETLQEYCNKVYIDLDRSDAAAVEELMAKLDTEREAAPKAEAFGQIVDSSGNRIKLDSPLFGNNPLADREAFGNRVERAAKSRGRLREAIVGALRAVVGDRTVDVDKTRSAVGHMAEVIQEDPTASLWLTHLNANDDYTSRHAINSCVLALTFGRNMGLKGKALEAVGMGTLLMDVGRMLVPGKVFPKPGKLSETEWSHVQRHVDHGVRLLNRSSVPDDALDIVRMHHERLLGQGYPNGLMADRIPKPALVAGLVDSYDAMLHKRPYRDAFRPDQAVQLLYKDANSTFGQDLVSDFIWYLGTYPVGTVVELDNGAMGVVVGSHPGKGVSPTVLLVRNANGEPMKRRTLVNLAAANAMPKDKSVPGRSIKRTLSPQEARIPVGKIVASEFGLDQLILTK